MSNPHPPTRPSPPDLATKQETRVREYLATALEEPDPLRANAAAVSSDLMDLAHRLKTGLDDAVKAGLHTFNDFEKLAPALNAFLHMTRQIQSFARLDCQLAEARGGALRRRSQSSPPAPADDASEESGV